MRGFAAGIHRVVDVFRGVVLPFLLMVAWTLVFLVCLAVILEFSRLWLEVIVWQRFFMCIELVVGLTRHADVLIK